jgi:thymidylate synthase
MFKNVNSNYGWCVFAAKNFSQYDFCIDELKKNHQSRKAQMIYTRPSIVIDYNFNGMSDYICTNNVHCFIRKNKLIYIVNQRSCDAIYGFLNDWAWHRFVAQKMLIELNLDFGKIIYNIDSLHIYDRHYDILQKIGKEVNNECKC